MAISEHFSLGKKLYLLRPKLHNHNYENPLMENILNSRNSQNIQEYLDKKLKTHWPKLQEIPNLEATIDFIHEIKNSQKTIGIVGDYDVDGVSATAMLIECFREMNIKAIYAIPNRFIDGYGVSIGIIKKLIDEGAQVILTVDNGTTAYDAINYLKSINIPMIIIDHHGLQLPIDVKYFINPHIYSNIYTILCATSLTFIVLSELNKKYNYGVAMKNYLDWVVLATICDVMPLIALNRALVHYGLEKIRLEPREFIHRLLGDNHKKADVRSMGFIIGPHINAPGRFGNSQLALDFMINTNDENFADVVLLNIDRRTLEQKITEEAIELVDHSKPYTIVFKENWHEGIIGITAGRLKDMFMKPTLVLTKNGDYYKGSFRSVDNWHVGNFIKAAKSENLLIHGGGHSKAGGVVFENLQLFTNFMEKYFLENPIDPVIYDYVDGVVSLEIINHFKMKRNSHKLNEFAPYGEENPIPLFFFPNVMIMYYDIQGEDCVFYINNSVHRVQTIGIRIFNIAKSPFNILRENNLLVHIIGTIERGFLNIKDVIIPPKNNVDLTNFYQ